MSGGGFGKLVRCTWPLAGLVLASGCFFTKVDSDINGEFNNDSEGVSSDVGADGSLNGALISLELTVASTTLPIGSAISVSVLAVDDAGLSEDVTAGATISSSNVSVVEVSGGIATAKAPGSVTLTATFSGLEATLDVTAVQAALTQLAIGPASVQVAAGTTAPLDCVASFQGGLDISVTQNATWTVASNTIATVNAGLVEGVAVGSTAASCSYGNQTAESSITVTDATLQAVDLELAAFEDSNITEGDPKLPLGFTGLVFLMGTFSDGSTQNLSASASWSASSASSGVFSGYDAGTHFEIGTLAQGAVNVAANYQNLEASLILEVTAPIVTSLSLVPDGATQLSAGNDLEVQILGEFSDFFTGNAAGHVTVTSSNPAVASVTLGIDGAVVTGQATGTTTIRAEAPSGADATLTITVL